MEYKMNNTLKFEFTVEQANIILTALARMPYESVVGLINEMQKQAQSQVGNAEQTNN